jgi:hypothetical protein
MVLLLMLALSGSSCCWSALDDWLRHQWCSVLGILREFELGLLMRISMKATSEDDTQSGVYEGES